ncbi:MAG TPA: DNA cytosine methyltransferase [Candidatus Lokiarchaeia archaeon]|nr:DNA cytosine methyltransferase [Candidatus Lokiarchaeia archaeon]
MERRENPWFVDLFAGCGGFSKGFLDAGFQHLEGNEIWLTAVETYKKNIGPGIICGDINDANIFGQLVDSTKNHEPFVVIGGPPCQGFSTAGNRNPIDPRGQLWKKFVEFVDVTKPVAFVMENVKGIISMKHLDANISASKKHELEKCAGSLQRIKDLRRYARQRDLTDDENYELEKLVRLQKTFTKKIANNLVPLLPQIISALEHSGSGYTVQHKILNAANYGVAQLRERFIAIGIRIDIFEKIKEKYGEDVMFHPVPQYLDMIEDQAPKIPKYFKNLINSESTLKPFVTVREAISDLADVPEESIPNHVFMKHKPEFIKRIAETQPGNTVFPSYTDGWYRLLPDRPSRTVKENHGGVHCHPWLPRTLTPRELARLQSFPDSFAFSGKKSEVWVQIGNAVPPLLGKAIAEKLLDLIRCL